MPLVPLSQGAHIARVSYHRLLTLLQRGDVAGEWQARRWFVDQGDCERLAAQREAETRPSPAANAAA